MVGAIFNLPREQICAHSILDIFHCLGHTPRLVVFVHRNTKLAIVGNVLFKDSIGRTDLPKGDFNSLIDSIKNNLQPLGEQFAFIPDTTLCLLLERICAATTRI